MSWLKTIYESVVNEIGADDAYNRFYNSIPREDYDEILGGNPAPDKFMQFILNCVRDGKSTKEDAVEAVQAYNNADQLVKQNVLNKFRTGEYSDALDVTSDIKYLSSGGAILSKNKFAKEGFIKLKENDRWLATCTTNYMASNHYFGDSHWCTASDREGRYDGYEMFRQYTDGDDVLIQFKWKGKVLPEPENDDDVPESLDDKDRAQYDDELGYVGDAIAKDDSMYQVQISGDGYIGQICDWGDNSSSKKTLKKVIGKEMYSVLEDYELLKWLLNKTNESVGKEAKYQESVTELIKKKRERKEKAFNEKKAKLEAECEEANKQKDAFVMEKWNEFVNNKLYRDPNVISYMYERDVNGEYNGDDDRQKEEERLAKTNYATIVEVEVSNVFSVLQIGAVRGLSKYVEYDYDTYDCEIMEAGLASEVGGKIALIVHDNGKSIDHVMGPYDENVSMSIKELRNGAGRWERRFYEVHVELNDDSVSELGLIFDAKLNKGITYRGFRFYEYFSLGNGECLLSRNMRSNYIIYNTETGAHRTWKDGDPVLYTLLRGNGISLYDYDGKNGQTLYVPDRGLYGLKLPDTRKVDNLEISSDMPKNGDVIGIWFDSQKCNAILVGAEDYLFGMDGMSIHVTNPNRCGMVFREKSVGKRINSIIIYEDGNFTKTGVSGAETIPCDRYGQSKEEQMRKKNFQDWLANGGHSPEVKAQMDKMWADRNGDDDQFSGDAAMKAWNDDDRLLDKGENFLTYSPDYAFNRAMQTFDKDDRWRGSIGTKDPEGFADSIDRALKDPDYGITPISKGNIPDYVRRNPWYRIGKNGQPIDQPWDTEDEIPARLSDRIVREQKIKEGVNRLRSLWGRMGLNEE